MKLYKSISVGAILVAIVASAAYSQTRTVVFSEIMWMGSSKSSKDKWIELRNTTSDTVDMSGWLITKLSGDEETEMLTLPDNSVLGPYEVFLIARYSADDTNSVLGVRPDLISSKVSFSKSNLQL
ncbi:MAG: hypothetical protein DRQ08_00840 [Candidatus Latescibacterota bacterium]|nr:MAG: hypothetical protein DRQ08_00840 [Candidatus Latescibacterota bacterium]